MKRLSPLFEGPLVGRIVVVMLCGVVLAASPGVASETDHFSTKIRPLLSAYCLGCHDAKKKKGDVDLSRLLDESTLASSRKVWSTVAQAVQAGEMPPKGVKQPTAEEREKFLHALQTALRRIDAARPRDPGRVTMRRLNRTEYNNTIRDLCHIEFEPADSFPADDAGHGFDNIGDVLSLSPVLMERYLDAAEAVVARTLATGKEPGKTPNKSNGKAAEKPAGPKVRSGLAQFITATNGSSVPQSMTLFHSEPVALTFVVAADGEYAIRLSAEPLKSSDERVEIGIDVDGQSLPRTTFERTEKSDKIRKPAKELAESRVILVSLKRGKHVVQVRYLNPPKENEATPQPPLVDRIPTRTENGCILFAIDLVGPTDAVSTSRRRILACDPKAAPREQATQILSRFATRAFRRPASAEEIDRYVKLFDNATAAGDAFEPAIATALEAILVSPRFLFRAELDDGTTKGPQPISEYALASRLSYFLWNSMPDDELFDLAARGTLSKNLEAQVERMLADWKADAFAANFAPQWLGIRGIELLNRTDNFVFSLRLRHDMARETVLFFDAVVRENRPITDFIDGRYSFLNARLASLYRIRRADGDVTATSKAPSIPAHTFVKVALPADGVRAGILTHASVLTVTSNSDRTSPVKRGNWILENILASPPPPPPPDVPDLDNPEKKAATPTTLRERLQLHRAKADCAGCHAKIDPLGFALEKFDLIGVYRDNEKGQKQPIDDEAELPDGQKFRGPEGLRKILLERKTQFARGLTEKMLIYSLGRGVEAYDAATVDGIVEALSRDNYRMRTLIFEIVKSDAFRMRRGDRGGSK